MLLTWANEIEYQRAVSRPQPEYRDFALGIRFSCECWIDGIDTPFGSQHTLFRSKKEARQYAAKCAVEHFKAKGLWPDSFTDVGGIKKKKVNAVNAVNTSQPVLIGVSKVNDTTGTANETSANATTQLAVLASELNLGLPEFRQTQEDVEHFYTVACYFRQPGGEFTGPYGELRHVYGKKRAKQDCAVEVLRHLQGLKEKRTSLLEQILRESEPGVVKKGTVSGNVNEAEETDTDEFLDAEDGLKGDV